MPNKRNGIYKGKPKLHLRSLYSEDGNFCELGNEEMATKLDPRLQEENLNSLLDMFPNVDKDIVQAVLQEYNFNLTDSVEKLSEISGQYSELKMEEKNIDLALIACSLLADESQPVGTSRLEIYDNPEGFSADLGSAAISDAVAHDQENPYNSVYNFSTTTDFHESYAANSSVENTSYPVSSRNGIGEIPQRYAAESVNDNTVWQDCNIYFERNTVNSFNVFNNENSKILKQKHDFLNNSTDSTNIFKGTEDSKMRNEVRNSLHLFTNSTISANNTDSDPYYFNEGDVKTNVDHLEKYTTYANRGCPDSGFSVADVNMKKNVINNEVFKVDEKVKTEVPSINPLITTYLNRSDDLYLNSSSKTSYEWDKFYSNIEPDVFNAYCESMKHIDAGKTEPDVRKVPTVTMKTAYPPVNSTANLGRKVVEKNISKMKTKLSQENNTRKVYAHVNSDYIEESSETIPSSVAANNSSDVQVKSQQKFTSSESQNVKASYPILNSEDDGSIFSKGKLSPSALEFIPRPLAIFLSKQPAQDKDAHVNTASRNQKSDMPETLKLSQAMSPGKKKGAKAKKVKEENKVESNDQINHSGRNHVSHHFRSVDYTCSPTEDVKTSANSECQKVIDPTDPLGWGDILGNILVVDSKPQRMKKAKKNSNNKSKQPAPLPALSPWQKLVDKPGENKLNASQVSPSRIKNHASPAESIAETIPLLSTHEISEYDSLYHLSSSENYISSENIPRIQKLCDSPISTRLPPSLNGKVVPAILATKVNSSLENVPKIPSPTSSPKKKSAHMTLETTKPPSSAPVPQLVKNKLQLRGIKTPVGVMRRYILEKQPVVIILRGLPGSGKTYLAKQLITECHKMGVQGVILSTDDYFLNFGQYTFDKNNLPDAHDWNKKRALKCMKESRSPIIIDNTNTTMWELLPYAVMALEHRFDVQIFEPDTAWKFKVMELARKNVHGVRKGHIKTMKDRWETFTLDDVLKQSSESMASRKTSAVVQVDNGMSSVAFTDQEMLPVDNQMTDPSEKVPATAVSDQKSSQNISSTNSYQDLGLSEWFVSQTQRPKKDKQKNRSYADTADKSPKLEITQDFLNQSLKKAMVSMLKIPPSQAVQSQINSDVSKTVISRKSRMSDNDLTNRVTINERQQSDESSNSETPTVDMDKPSFENYTEQSLSSSNSETPTVDKDRPSFENYTEQSSVMNVKHSIQKEVTDLSPKVSLNLVEEFRQHDVLDTSSALNSSWSTCGSYHTVHSNSDISSYHTVDGDEEYMDMLSTDMLNSDDVEDKQLIKQDDEQLLQEFQSQKRNAGHLSSVAAEDEMLPIYFEQTTVVNKGDKPSSVEDKQHNYESCDGHIERMAAENASSVVETPQACSIFYSLSSDGTQTQQSSTESLSVLDYIFGTTVVTPNGDSDSKKDTTVVTSLMDSDSKKDTAVVTSLMDSDSKKDTAVVTSLMDSDSKKDTAVVTSLMDSDSKKDTAVVTSLMDSDSKKDTIVVTSLVNSNSKKSTTPVKSVVGSDNKKNTTLNSLTREIGDCNAKANTFCPYPLVEYSDSDDSDKELSLPQSDSFITVNNISEPCINEHFAEKENVQNSMAGINDNISSLTSENVSKHSQVDILEYIQDDKVSNRIYNREISVDRSTQSSEDSMMSGREQSPQIDSEAITEGVQLKKKKTRVRKGRNPGPFIEDSLKMKSKMHNWSSFVVPSSGSSNSSGESAILDIQSKKTDTSLSTTQTDPYYFSIIHKLNSPAFNSLQPVDLTLSGVNVIATSSQSTIHERWVSRTSEADTVPFRKTGSKVDQSTTTDETLEKEELDLETLQSCFPEYSRKQLETTMAICHNDIEWVTSHLLDSPALYDMEEDEDESMKADMLKPDKGVVTHGAIKRTVSSLANICSMLVRKTNKVDADDLEMQVIQVGEGRLNKIEMFGRFRLHSISQEDLGNQDYWPDDFHLDEYPVTITTQDLKKRQQSLRLDHASLFQPSHFDHESATVHTTGLLTTLMKEKQFTSSQFEEKQVPTYPSLAKSEGSSSDALIKHQNSKHIKEVNQTVIAQKQLVMPLEFVRHLESLYGPLQLQINDEASGVALDDNIGRKIYNCLKLQATKNVPKNSNEQQLKNDEALARALQDEENSKLSSAANGISASVTQGHESNRQSTVPGWTNHNPPWMSQGKHYKAESSLSGSINTSGESRTFRPHSVADTLHRLRGTKGSRVRAYIFQHKMPGTVKSVWYKAQKRGKVDSLVSIMEEEMAREEQQREQLRIIESSGDTEALATRIKRIELTNLFPSMGPDILDDIFRSTGYSKEETIKVLQQSYNILPVAISKDKEDIFDQFRKSQQDFQHVEDLYEDEFLSENSETDYDILRNEARLCRQLFVECQQQALRYQSDGMQGAALFYRQRAKKYKEDERAANSRAAQVLFEKGSERLHVENTLDLHFYHLDEAINAVNMALEMKEDEYKKRPDRKNSYLDIVTGWGRNSRNGKPKLKPAIIHHLWAKCFQYEERSPGMLRVYLGKKL